MKTPSRCWSCAHKSWAAITDSCCTSQGYFPVCRHPLSEGRHCDEMRAVHCGPEAKFHEPRARVIEATA
ncbi:hypothetical protein [Azohydromonas aeria]|uniref:hypothetical protein n=1 Tax=Azohydromonas aeria TaxID=2590212 RepID=UPI0012FC9BCC|nr:hypothetical protein [Azohydromonas aeria]